MSTKETPSSRDQSQSPEVPGIYLVVILGALALLIITIAITFAVRQQRVPHTSSVISQAQASAESVSLATKPASTPTDLPAANAIALPKPTQAVALPRPTATQQPSDLPLPTVTPTPLLPPPPPREVVISGSTTMRLALSGEGFDSTGRPLSFEIAPRAATLGGDIQTLSDTRCIQLGLVNELLDLTARIDPATEDVLVGGSISLRTGFCDQPGEEMDRTEVNLTVPTDAAAKISYNLRGQSSLLGLEGILDSDTGAIVELRVLNAMPE